MSDLEREREILAQNIVAEKPPASDHHAKIMEELDSLGFKANPAPQIGFEQPNLSSKSCFYFS